MARGLIWTGMLLATTLLGGCWSGQKLVNDSAFAGPPVTFGSAEGRHVLVVTAPTPGWLIAIDRTDRLLDETQVFVTMQRPDPGALYPQHRVEQRVLSDVPQSRPIRVYSRVVDFNQRRKMPPYHPVDRPGGDSG